MNPSASGILFSQSFSVDIWIFYFFGQQFITQYTVVGGGSYTK